VEGRLSLNEGRSAERWLDTGPSRAQIVFEIFQHLPNNLSICLNLPGVPDGARFEVLEYAIGSFVPDKLKHAQLKYLSDLNPGLIQAVAITIRCSTGGFTHAI
jgi:hypothetical protein